MPRYQVTLDGKTYVLEGDHPPSEAEARAAIGPQSGPSTSPGQRMDAAPPSFGDQLTASLKRLNAAGYEDPQKLNQGLLLGGVGPSVGEIVPAISNSAKAMQAVKTIGTGAAVSGLNYGADKLGIPHAISYPILAALGLAGIKSGLSPAAAEEANVGGRLITTKAPTVEQQMADALGELRQPAKPQGVSLPPQAELPQGYNPRTTAPPVQLSPNVGGRLLTTKAPSTEQHIADVLSELLQAPKAQTTSLPPQAELPNGYMPRATGPRISNLPPKSGPATPAPTPISPTLQPSPSAFVNVDSPMESGRNWHSGVTTEADKASAAALHRYDADLDAQYRNATAGERAGFRMQPLSFKDALVALLQNGGK